MTSRLANGAENMGTYAHKPETPAGYWAALKATSTLDVLKK